MEDAGIPHSNWPGCIENLFSPALRAEAEEAGELALTTTPYAELLTPQCFPMIQEHLIAAGDIDRHYVLAAEPESKVRFAQWIAERARAAPEILEPLRPVVDGIRRILTA